MITRDPYARLLSAYLNKVIEPHEHGEGPQSQLHFHKPPPPRTEIGGDRGSPTASRSTARPAPRAWRATADDFGAFVQGLARIGPRAQIGDVDAQMHLLPITANPRADRCLPPLRQRTAAGFREAGLRWVRLEEMDEWYPQLLRAVPPLGEAAADPRWGAHGRPHPCYWVAHGHTCNSTTVEARVPSQGPRSWQGGGGRCAKQDAAVSKYHTTDACSQLREFYNSSEVIRAATGYLRGDLDAFGYSEMEPL
jgi:hypothetical protein